VFGLDRRIVKTVEFYPPNDLPSGEIGYLVDGKIQQRDLLSMILWWASKGCIRIEETAKGRFALHRIASLPPEAKSWQTILFGALFAGKDRVDLGSPNQAFAAALKRARKTLMADYKMDVRQNMYTRASVAASGISYVLAAVPLMIFVLSTALSKTPSWGNTMVNAFAVPIFCIAIVTAMVLARANANVGGVNLAVLKLLMGFAPVCLPFVLLMFVFAKNLIVQYPADAAAAVAATVVSVLFASNARQRTKAYNTILGRILGFKDFIRVAETDRMERLFEQDPEYYFKTLPYAWVFGLSDIWAKKFENIVSAPPSWYSGYYGTDFNTGMMARSISRLHTAAALSSKPPASTGGGSSGGGGGSSSGFSGGGGSSGGGFGGGGGGRW
jgi:uncharacterized membrane protein YgcG